MAPGPGGGRAVSGPEIAAEGEILARLVGFPTIAGQPNLALIDWVAAFLRDAGFAVTLVPSADGTRAGLLARFGAGEGGVLFSAHSDVVAVAGQGWSTDPFTMVERDGRLVGRGTTDMKGFLACVLARAARLAAAPPARPMLIALSWDEELGCLGIREMIDRVIPVLGRPELVIVGEPTAMRLCIGHKGKRAFRALCHGDPGHSALAPRFVNALHLAADLVRRLQAEQAGLARSGPREAGHEIPYSTVHVGRLAGGGALNMIPERAEVDFEIRHVAADAPEAILARIRRGLPGRVEIAEVAAYPGLDTDPAHPAVAALAALLDDPEPVRVAFGTEAGFFARLGLPTVVCGPGDMADGHRPDESIACEQLARCARLLEELLQRR